MTPHAPGARQLPTNPGVNPRVVKSNLTGSPSSLEPELASQRDNAGDETPDG